MTELLQDFVKRAVEAAASVSISSSTNAALTSGQFPGESGDQVSKGSQLPLEVNATLLGRYAVLFGLLPPAPDPVLVADYVRRYRNQLVIARSHLGTDQALDLQLWLMGPHGSDLEPEWKALSLAIERDDRVARKLVWLPPNGPEERNASFEEFVSRTFLARPWNVANPHSTGQLDRFSEVVSVVSDLGLSQEILSRWIEIAGSDIEDGPVLIDALLAVWEEGAP